MSDDEMQELIRHGWIPPPRALSERELLREALEALDSVTHCRNPDKCKSCSNIARAAADKIRAALTQEKQT